jgi:hypothetical protein
MQGKASAFDEDTCGEVSDVAADDDYIPDCVGLTWEKWCKKEVTLLNEGGEGVATGFVEFARSSQTVDGRSTLGDYNVGVVVCEVIQGLPSVRSVASSPGQLREPCIKASSCTTTRGRRGLFSWRERYA